jgi:hypothetical protein
MGQKEPQTRFKKLRELPDGFDMITTRLRKRYRKGHTYGRKLNRYRSGRLSGAEE